MSVESQYIPGDSKFLKYSATSHIRAVWDQGVPVIVKVPVSMNPLLPV